MIAVAEEVNQETNEAQKPQDEGQPKKANFSTVLRNRNFRNLWLGQLISSIGDYFAFLAITVVVAGFSNDPANTTGAVSGAMIALALPRLLFGVLAGVFVDRWDRRRTMLVSDLVRVGLTLAFIPAFLSHNLWLVYAIAFAMSSVATLFMPAKGALIPQLVSEEQLVAANSLSQTSMTLAFFIGPALAGMTFVAAGNGNQWVAFIVDSISFVISAIAIWSIRVPREAEVRSQKSEVSDVGPIRKVWHELVEGLKALILSRSMAVLTVVFAVTMLGVGALNVLWVVFLKLNFGYQDAELAWRFSVIDIAFFAGMAGASILTGNLLSNVAPKWLIVVGLVGAGLIMAPLGYLPDYWLVVGVMLLCGLFVAPINTGAATLMQVVVPNSQLGRVGGGIGTITETASLTSMSLAGVLGAAWGIPFVFLLGGLLCALGGVVAWAFLPGLTMKDKVEEPQPTIEAAQQAA